MPAEWKESHIIKLPKKGVVRECKKSRGISLLTLVRKILNRVMLLRPQAAVDAVLRDQKAGFRKDGSFNDQIATPRLIIEQSIEWDTSVYINFVDFEKAFDSLDRNALWNVIMHYGIPGKFIRIFKNSYCAMTCKIVHSGKLTDSFAVKKGLKQEIFLTPLPLPLKNFQISIKQPLLPPPCGIRNECSLT